MTIKYLLQPGWVLSSTDGQDHYIGPRQLVQLYGVSFSECIVEPSLGSPYRHGWRQPEGLIALCPRYSGDYTIKEPNT